MIAFYANCRNFCWAISFTWELLLLMYQFAENLLWDPQRKENRHQISKKWKWEFMSRWSGAKRKDEFISRHNPTKKKNLILLELKLRSFITWNEMFMIMLRASTPATIYTAILKANNDNEMFVLHSLLEPCTIFHFRDQK